MSLCGDTRRGEETPVASKGTISVSGSQSPWTARLWRPAAQRNMRNQWSRLLSCRMRWVAASLEGRSISTALVNAHLTRRYMPDMNLGVLKDMPMIREHSCEKLARKEELCQRNLLCSYKEMVDALCQSVKARGSMRCYMKGPSSSPLIKFSQLSQDSDDPGDGAGVAVFISWPLTYFDQGHFIWQRLIVQQLVFIGCHETQEAQTSEQSWPNELYDGELDDLATVNLLCKETFQPTPPRIRGFLSDDPAMWKISRMPTRETLQVYLTAWIADLNIDTMRVDEIFRMVEEEMQLTPGSFPAALILDLSASAQQPTSA
ncbi:uncharacterized protein LOC144702161 isoform X2 [Wolffia australiana]